MEKEVTAFPKPRVCSPFDFFTHVFTWGRHRREEAKYGDGRILNLIVAPQS